VNKETESFQKEIKRLESELFKAKSKVHYLVPEAELRINEDGNLVFQTLRRDLNPIIYDDGTTQGVSNFLASVGYVPDGYVPEVRTRQCPLLWVHDKGHLSFGWDECVDECTSYRNCPKWGIKHECWERFDKEQEETTDAS